MAINTFTMVMFRARIVLAVLVTAMIPPLQAASLPDYKIGDVAVEDVITPVALQVVNPEATEVLKQKVTQQVNFIVRHSADAAVVAERDLRESMNAGRTAFLAAFELSLGGRAVLPSDFDSPRFMNTVRQVARTLPKDFPLETFAPFWAQAMSDEADIAALVQPLREVMAQPIVNNRNDNQLPASQPVRVIPVKNATVVPTGRELETGGVVVPSARVLSLWRARRLVETHFGAGKEMIGRFVASFVQPNAFPDPALTDVARAQRTEGVTVNDSYDAAQVVVRKGQTIDRKALSALAVLREKSMIGTLQSKLQQEQTMVGVIDRQTKWIVAGLAFVGFGLFIILWRLRARPSTALVVGAGDSGLPFAEQRSLPGGSGQWRERALVAEDKAQRAHEAIRSGALGWMREKIFQTLFRHRSELLSSQQKAEAEMRELEQRLEQLHTPLQERISAYERRIEELEKDLAAKGEENRELIGARISVARQQLLVERERGRFGTN